jgi:hypothetical protein
MPSPAASRSCALWKSEESPSGSSETSGAPIASVAATPKTPSAAGFQVTIRPSGV